MHYLQALAAHIIWGIIPIYWKLLSEQVDPREITCHRILWSLVTLLLFITLLRQWGDLKKSMKSPRQFMLAAFAALMISINWLVFIWAVINKSVVDSSLGYFINPLFSVLIGVFIFKEKLVSVQWLAISVAAIGIVISAYSSERLWVALVLATSFSIYGAIKKETRMPAIAGLGVETAILAPIALFYVMLQMSSRDTFYSGNSFALLMLGGPVTTLPLVLFAAAAKHVPMVYMGMMQYVGPTLQFILGWFLFGETINPWRLMGFSLVWLALAIFSVHAIVQYRRSQLLAPVS